MNVKRLKTIPAIILAGGLGTRIKGLASDVPKPLIKVGGYNLLEHNLFNLREAGVKEFVISIGYRGELIKDYFGEGEEYGIHLDYVVDPYPLGDAGALKYTFSKVGGTAILANADEIREGLDLKKMVEYHMEKGSLATMAVIEQPDIENHGIVELNRKKRVTRFMMNPSSSETSSCYANSGLYIMEEGALKCFPNGPCKMKDVLKDLVASKKLYGFVFEGTYFNVGTPEMLKKANAHFENQISQER